MDPGALSMLRGIESAAGSAAAAAERAGASAMKAAEAAGVAQQVVADAAEMVVTASGSLQVTALAVFIPAPVHDCNIKSARQWLILGVVATQGVLADTSEATKRVVHQAAEAILATTGTASLLTALWDRRALR